MVPMPAISPSPLLSLPKGLSLKGEGESEVPFDFRSFSLLWGGNKILRFDGL